MNTRGRDSVVRRSALASAVPAMRFCGVHHHADHTLARGAPIYRRVWTLTRNADLAAPAGIREPLDRGHQPIISRRYARALNAYSSGYALAGSCSASTTS